MTQSSKLTQTRKLMTFKHTLLAATALLGLALATPRAQANIFQTGDVVEYIPSSTTITVHNPTSGSSASYSLSTGIANSYDAISSFGTAGILYSTGSGVNEMNQSGASSTFLTAAAGDTITTVMTDANNNVYTAGYNSGNSTNFISEYTSAGTLLSTHTFAQSTGQYGDQIYSAALSANAQTLYFAQKNGGLFTYNMTTGVAQLFSSADLAATYGIQVMTNGNILASLDSGYGVNEYTPSGTVVTNFVKNSYPVQSSFSGGLALDSTGNGFWTLANTYPYGPMYLDFPISGASPTIGDSWSVSSETGIAVIGSVTALNASQSSGSTQTPTSAPEPAALPLLAGMLGLLAMVKLARPGRRVG